MNQSRINQLIDSLYEYIDTCKPKSFMNTTQVIVIKDDIYAILDEMKETLPEEVKRCAKIVVQKDKIIANAEEKAAKIIEEAKRQAEMLVQESEIMRQVYLQANEILSVAGQKADVMCAEAEEEAERIATGALRYTDDMFSQIENVLAVTYQETKKRNEDMLRILEDNLRIVQENRRDLQENVAPVAETVPENNLSYQNEEEGHEEMYQDDSESF